MMEAARAPANSQAYRMDPTVDAASARALSAMIERVGFLSGGGPSAPVSFFRWPEGGALDREPTGAQPSPATRQEGGAAGPRVALHRGRLEPEHAEALRRLPCIPLLAAPEDGLPSEWELRCLGVLLSGRPLITHVPPSQLRAWRVTSLDDLRSVVDETSALAKAAGGRAAGLKLASEVMYELMANAFFDAPVDSSGRPKYAHTRSSSLKVDVEDACAAGVAVDEDRIYLAVTDRFGRLTAEPVANAVEGLDRPAKVNPSGGGAGLGMRQIVEKSDLISFRVTGGLATEAFCAVHLGDSRRRRGSPKSLFFAHDGRTV